MPSAGARAGRAGAAVCRRDGAGARRRVNGQARLCLLGMCSKDSVLELEDRVLKVTEESGDRKFQEEDAGANAWGTQGMIYLGSCTYSSFDFILLIHIELSVCQTLF